MQSHAIQAHLRAWASTIRYALLFRWANYTESPGLATNFNLALFSLTAYHQQDRAAIRFSLLPASFNIFHFKVYNNCTSECQEMKTPVSIWYFRRASRGENQVIPTGILPICNYWTPCLLMCMKDQYKLPVTQWNTTQCYCRLKHKTNTDLKNKIIK